MHQSTNGEILNHDNICVIGAGLNREQSCNLGSQGVGIVLSMAAVEAWKAAGSEVHNTYGARVMAIRLQVRDTQGRDLYLFLISAYAPVGNADQSVWDEYLTNLNNCISKKQREDLLIIGSDTNASMGCSNEFNSLGNFGIRYMNESGRRFASYLTINDMVAVTTCFRKKCYGTWVNPRSTIKVNSPNRPFHHRKIETVLHI